MQLSTYYTSLYHCIWNNEATTTIDIGCKTQTTLIFENIFKAASLSSYIIVRVKILDLLNKQPPYLIKIFLK